MGRGGDRADFIGGGDGFCCLVGVGGGGLMAVCLC